MVISRIYVIILLIDTLKVHVVNVEMFIFFSCHFINLYLIRITYHNYISENVTLGDWMSGQILGQQSMIVQFNIFGDVVFIQITSHVI